VTSPPVPDATTWPAIVVVGSETQYPDVTSAGTFEAVRSVSGERLEWVVVTRGAAGADAYAASSELHVDAVAADQIDATGAGDAFTVGLLHGLLQGDGHDHSAAGRRRVGCGDSGPVAVDSSAMGGTRRPVPPARRQALSGGCHRAWPPTVSRSLGLRARAVKDSRPPEPRAVPEASSRVTPWQLQISRRLPAGLCLRARPFG
jgi:pfkB family carbohydrate kinase